MKKWTEVSSIKDLNAFQIQFKDLDDDDKQEIITEMILFLAAVREKESQMDLFDQKPRQVEKTLIASGKLRRAKRATRKRLTG